MTKANLTFLSVSKRPNTGCLRKIWTTNMREFRELTLTLVSASSSDMVRIASNSKREESPVANHSPELVLSDLDSCSSANGTHTRTSTIWSQPQHGPFTSPSERSLVLKPKSTSTTMLKLRVLTTKVSLMTLKTPRTTLSLCSTCALTTQRVLIQLMHNGKTSSISLRPRNCSAVSTALTKVLPQEILNVMLTHSNSSNSTPTIFSSSSPSPRTSASMVNVLVASLLSAAPKKKPRLPSPA